MGICHLFHLHLKGDVAFFRKLRRIVHQVGENLGKAKGVAHQGFRNFGVYIYNQLDRTPRNTDFGQGGHLADGILQHELNDFQFLFLGFNFREVQNVVDNAQQGFCRTADTVHKAVLPLGKFRF